MSDLPIRIAAEFDAPAIRVDGLPASSEVTGAAGLHLSHWPGHQTPASLRHDLSTGAALRFAALAPEERARLAGDAQAIVNNHYDTDGTCALFAVHRPELARRHESTLLAAAACGDFFQFPNELAFQIERVVQAFADPARSPLGAALAELADEERYQRATEGVIEILPRLLEGEVEPWRALWEPELDALRADLADLDASARDDIVHLDWTVWTGDGERPSSRGGAQHFDPGRHALWGRTSADRILVIGPSDSGATYRLLVSTRSWFDLESTPPPTRPDLAALAENLRELEAQSPGAERGLTWHHQVSNGPSPELWFGSAEARPFQEHAAQLAPSALAPSTVRRAVADALRTTLVLE